MRTEPQAAAHEAAAGHRADLPGAASPADLPHTAGPADLPVPIMPLLRLADLCAAPQAEPLPYPFGEAGVSCWYNARAAIWQGLRSLGIVRGDRVIAPAYTCGSELDTLVQAGLTLDFYRIGPDLGADLADLERMCATPAAAIFVTHFYGLPQPIAHIAAIAQRHGMRLIEDVSHGLYSATACGQPLGSFGDMAVFSLWKSLAVPDGGVLRLRLESVRVPLPVRGEAPGLASMAGRLRHMLEETVASRHPDAVRALRRRVTDPLVRALRPGAAPATVSAAAAAAAGASMPASMPESAPAPAPAPRDLASDRSLPPEALQLAFRPERRAWRMTALSSYLLPRLSHAAMVGERREHFRSLTDRVLPGPAVYPLLSELPAHTNPLFFPLVAAEPRAFCRHLAAHRIGFFRGWCVFHPAVDWSRFPYESQLKEQVVVVPIHQGLSDAEMARIACAVNAWNQRPGGRTALP